jgi:hydroxyjasmonate sulfotransferase
MASSNLTHLMGDQSRDGQEANQQDKVNHEFKQLILSLPRIKGWGASQDFYFFQGFWCPSNLIQPINSFQNHFQAKDNDIVVASLPKSGTTWLKALTFAIVNRHRFSSLEDHPLLKFNSHELVPFFEYNVYGGSDSQSFQINLSNMNEPRLFGTHVPFFSLAKSIKESNCKIIYICRNPFDTFVSTWFFANKIRSNQSLPTLNMDEFFESYCDGISPFGSFWDHNLGYLKESMARSHKVLFLKYKDLKEDAISHVNRIANFLGYPFTREEESNKEIENIINLCGFEKMKELEVNKSGSVGLNYENKFFFRKAEVGDWINYLSPSMEEKLSKIIEEKLSGPINNLK